MLGDMQYVELTFPSSIVSPHSLDVLYYWMCLDVWNLVHAQAKLRHWGLEHLSHPEVNNSIVDYRYIGDDDIINNDKNL